MVIITIVINIIIIYHYLEFLYNVIIFATKYLLVTFCQRICRLKKIKTGPDIGQFGKRMSRYVAKLKNI